MPSACDVRVSSSAMGRLEIIKFDMIARSLGGGHRVSEYKLREALLVEDAEADKGEEDAKGKGAQGERDGGDDNRTGIVILEPVQVLQVQNRVVFEGFEQLLVGDRSGLLDTADEVRLR